MPALVEEQDRCVLEHGACDGDALALAAGEGHPILAEGGFVAPGQVADELVDEMLARPGGVSSVTGKVPLSEMFQYSTMLRSITQGRGTYSMEPSTYEAVPPNIAEKVLEEYSAESK